MSLDELKFIFGSKLNLATPNQIKRMDEHLWNDDIEKMRMIGYEIDEEPIGPQFPEYNYEPMTVPDFELEHSGHHRLAALRYAEVDSDRITASEVINAHHGDFVRERLIKQRLRMKEAEMAINPMMIIKKKGGD